MVNWLSHIIEYLTINAIGLQVLFTILIFFATAIYVIFNSLMHKEMVKQRRREETPDISITFEQEPNVHTLFFIAIKNISTAEVFDLKFIKYPVLKLWTVGTTSDIGFIKEGIKYIGVNQLYKDHFLSLSEKENRNKILEFEIEFYNKDRKKYIKIFSLNTAMFNSIGVIQHTKFEDEIKKIRELLENFVNK